MGSGRAVHPNRFVRLVTAGFARLVMVCVVAMALGACGQSAAAPAGSGATDGDRPRVVVTTNVLGDAVRAVAGDAADVEVLMPAGADPHSFEPSAKQAGLLQEADLVIANGLGLEAAMAGTLASAAADGVRVVELAEHVDPIPFGDAAGPATEEGAGGDTTAQEGASTGHGDAGEAAERGDADHDEAVDHDDEHAGEAAGHDHGALDPHFWMDPLRMTEAVHVVGRELAGVDPDEDWETRADAYVAELGALDREIRALLDGVPQDRREFVTNHDAFSYFAQRYGLVEIGTVIPAGTTLAEPSAADLENLVAQIRQHDVAAIFVETTASSRLAQAVADEAGVEVVELYSGSMDADDPAADTYVDMMRTNAERIAEALSG